MRAKELLSVLKEFDKTSDFQDFKILGISIDSRKVGRDFCFIAIKGTESDGHDFAGAA